MGNQQTSSNLRTYLNDHLAGSAAGSRLADRLAESLRESEPALAGVADEVRRDRETLMALMERLGVEPSRVKQAVGRVAELASRAKTSRPLVRGRQLGTMLELEALVLGIEGKLRLWESLRVASGTDPRISETEVAELGRRARSQVDQVEQARLRLAGDALAAERDAT